MIIDNFLSQKDWDYCYEYFKQGYWQFPNLSGIQGNQGWRIFNPEVESNIGKVLYNALSKHNFKPYAIKRVGINGATTLNESHLHRDGPPGDLSLIWFASKDWDKSYGGNLKVYTKNNLTEPTIIEYNSNRAVIFDSNLLHIPDTPSVKNILRITVGLHLTPSDKWEYKYIARVS
jgi:hypothetical protein